MLATPLATGAVAAPAPVPLPKVALPPTIDWQAEYQGQKLCSDWAKPGAVKLSALLKQTYGSYTTYITRSCATAGVSEHEEGRAIDWMVDEEIPEQRAKAEAFLEWVTAPGPNGEPGAMARRLGIMYLIWDDKMWRVYRPEDGWQEYSGCSKKQAEAYDTSCHRDHIHISLTWDGAYAKTSFWTGSAETRGPCTPSSTSRPAGSSSKPATLINTDTGTGVGDGNCRLGASDSYRSRTYKVKVPVPAGPDPVQQIRLERFDLNAPESLRIASAETVVVEQGTKPGAVLDVPLRSDGVITFTVGAGYGQLWVRGLGNGAAAADAPAPAPQAPARPVKVKLAELSTTVTRVNTPITLTGRVRRAPEGSTILLQRRLGTGSYATVATAVPSGRKYSVPVPAITRAGSYEFRAVLVTKTEILALGPYSRQLLVKPARVSLARPARIASGGRATLNGTIAGAPAGAALKVMHRAPGKRWVVRRQVAIGNGAFTTGFRVSRTGKSRVQVSLVGAGRTWDSSIRRKLVVRKTLSAG